MRVFTRFCVNLFCTKREHVQQSRTCFLSPEACARLTSVEVHVGISDYFQDASLMENQLQYKDVVHKLNVS